MASDSTPTASTPDSAVTPSSDTPSPSPTKSKKRSADDLGAQTADNDQGKDVLTDEQEHELHTKALDGAAQVDLQTFVARHASKKDQLAAFASTARSKHQGRRTVADWETLLSEFNQRVVK